MHIGQILPCARRALIKIYKQFDTMRRLPSTYRRPIGNNFLGYAGRKPFWHLTRSEKSLLSRREQWTGIWMDTVNEETFRINPQCTLINANNPFMAWRVERSPKPKGDDNLFRICEGQFSSCSRTKLRYRSETHFIGTILACPAYHLERNQTPSPLMLA